MAGTRFVLGRAFVHEVKINAAGRSPEVHFPASEAASLHEWRIDVEKGRFPL